MSHSIHLVRRIVVAAAAFALVFAASLASDGGGDAVAHTAAPSVQQPLFDNFNGADYWYADFYGGSGDLFPLDRSYSTAGATLEEGESAPCGVNLGATVWIQYYADRSGPIEINASSPDFDAVLAVYTWDMSGNFLPSPPGAKLVPVGCGAADQNSSVSFSLVRDTQYYIQIGGQNGGSGNVNVNATCVCSPPNDNFDRIAGAYVDVYQPEVSYGIDTAKATLQPGEQRPCANIGATVWFELYTNNATDIELTTAGSSFDTTIAVYTDPEYTWDITRLRSDRCVDSGAGGSAQSSLTLDAQPSTQYFIQVGGAGGATGALRFGARCVPVCPPYNDSVATAEWWDVPVQGASTPTDGATLEQDEPQPCGDIGKTVWYQITARGDTRIALDTMGSDFETVLAVYETVGFSPPPGSFDLIDCEAGGSSHLEFEATGNQAYWVQAGGVDGAGGQLTLNADCVPAPCPPFHDSIVQPYYFGRPLGPVFYTETFDVRGATTEPGEPLGCGDMGHTTWWAIDMYEGQPATPIVVDTRDSNFDTAIAVYEGALYGGDGIQPGEDAFEGLPQVACFEGGTGQRARASFTASPNKRYYVQIGGRGSGAGNLGVEISCDGPCPAENDMLAMASYIYPPFAHNIDTRATTTEAGEPAPCGNIGKTVWYRFDASGGGEYTISTAGSDFATVIAVYTMDQPSPPGGMTNGGCSTSGTLTIDGDGATTSFVQVGGVQGDSGALNLAISCEVCAIPGQGGGGVIYGTVSGPDTGSGGYLPGASD